MIGRRTNVDAPYFQNFEQFETFKKLADIAGYLDVKYAIDYFFIASNDFPWQRVPDLLVGRRYYDMFMVTLCQFNPLQVARELHERTVEYY